MATESRATTYAITLVSTATHWLEALAPPKRRVIGYHVLKLRNGQRTHPLSSGDVSMPANPAAAMVNPVGDSAGQQ